MQRPLASLNPVERFDMAAVFGRRPGAPAALNSTGVFLMRIHQDVTLDRVADAVERAQSSLDNLGFCIRCGAEAEGVEPDARHYECEACGELGVFGAEELLLRLALTG
jgi:hypothetical protein